MFTVVYKLCDPFAAEEEIQTGAQVIVDILPDKNQVVAYHPESREGLLYNFNHVFDEDASHETIFESVGERSVDAVLEGYNASLISYGK